VTLWEKYNPERSLAEVVADLSGIETVGLQEKTAFAILKRHLTRRELKSFVLHQSGMTPETVGSALGCDGETTVALYEKALRKLRQPAFGVALRSSLDTEEKGER
jgi:hypothetical protein